MKKHHLTDNPRGNLWRKDESRFGLKMLESMGWAPGKGLGANEDGCVEPIAVKFKDDVKGIGYKMRDDQWISHQDDFNALLSQLNGGKTFTDDDCKLQCLEAKSKRSKSRVHFHKFARWKDLSCRSERDIASILGKRQRKDDPPIEVGIESSEEKDMIKYFAQKMAEKKVTQRSETDSTTEQPTAKKSKLKRVTFNEELNDVRDVEETSESSEEKMKNKKKKKKKRSSKEREENDYEFETETKEEEIEDEVSHETNKRKENCVEKSFEMEECHSVKTRKKNKKHREDEEEVETNENDDVDRVKRKKIRSRKKVSSHKQEEDNEEKDGKILCETSSDNCTETEENGEDKVEREGDCERGKSKDNGLRDETMIGSVSNYTDDRFAFVTTAFHEEKRKVSVQTLVESMKTISMFEGSNFFSIKGYDGQSQNI